MKLKLFGLLFAIIFIAGCDEEEAAVPDDGKSISSVKEPLLVETFIQRNLLEKDGKMRTNITDRQDVYLSETVGLWMDYLIAKDDLTSFDNQVKMIETYFLTKDWLVVWELQGKKKALANAFIDDLRIVSALYTAGDKWNKSAYTELADKMSKSLVRYQTNEDLMVDYVDLENKAKGNDVTISYIIPEGFEQMKEHGHLPMETYQKTKQLLVEAPYSDSYLFPKVYHIPTGEYSYDEEVNMIDQFYVGYHRAQWDGEVSQIMKFAKEAFAAEEGKLFGRYDSKTKEPTVRYESVAVYALAILMSLEVEDTDFAKELYTQMKTLQFMNEDSPYNGGYIDIGSKDTHTFDNLLALFAERKGLDEEVF